MRLVSHPSSIFIAGLVAFLCMACQDDLGDRFPSVQITPSQFLFGRVVQDTTESRVVALENTGGSPLIIERIALDRTPGADPITVRWGDLEADPGASPGIDADGSDAFPYPLRIAPGATIYLTAAWTPIGEMPQSAAVVLSTNLTQPEITIPLVLDEGGPEIGVDRTPIDFGRVAGGEVEFHDLTVRNVGQQPLILEAPQIDGSSDFLAVVRDQPEAIAPGDEFAIRIRYAPRQAGPDRGELRLRSNDPNTPEVIIDLVGNSGIPCLGVNPTTLEFRSSLVDRADTRGIEAQSCGGQPVTVDRVELEPGTDAAFVLIQPALPIIIPAADVEGPLPGVTIEVRFTPRAERLHRGALLLHSDDPEKPVRRVPLIGRGVTNACPRAGAELIDFTIPPGDAIVLDGTPSVDPDGADNRPVSWVWEVTRRPDGSVAQPFEAPFDPAQPCAGGQPDDPNTPTAIFCPDLVGQFGLRLRVTDSLGLDSGVCDADQPVSVRSVPDEAVHIQATWRAPGDPDPSDDRGPDVDLHFIHPIGEWGQSPWDCHFRNPTPDWGQVGNSADDPVIDQDDIGGGGPENIRLGVPEASAPFGAPYLAGVEYYRSDDRVDPIDYGPVFVTLRGYVRGELVWTYDGPQAEGALPGEVRLDAEGDRWMAFELDWPSGETRTLDRLLDR